MRAALAVVLLLAGPAAAQPVAASRAEAPPLGHRVVLVASAVGSNAVTFWLLGPFAPLANAPVVYGTGYLLGHDAPFGRVTLDAGIGMAAGLVTFGMVRRTAVALNGGTSDFGTDVSVAIAGVVTSSVVTGLLYETDAPSVEVVPVSLRGPDGRRAAGLTLRVGL